MLETTFLYAAAVGGIFLVIQLVLAVVSGDGVDGPDLDADLGGDLSADGHHGVGSWFFEIVSLKTLAAASTFFGLAGMAARSYGATPTTSMTIAVIVGLAAMYSMYWLFKQLYRLESSGSEDIRNAMGMPAQVYVPIPAAESGMGKVHLRMQSRMVEYQAITNEADRLLTGENVVVVGIVNSDTLLVAREPSLVAESA